MTTTIFPAAKLLSAQRIELAMAAKFETEQGKLDYRKPKWIAEPPNGWIKNVLGFRQFSMRGLEKAKAEFKLVCLALNLRRMGSMQANCAHFSDRGHLFQADRGRRFSAIVDAQGMRASESLMYFTRQTRFRTGVAKRFG